MTSKNVILTLDGDDVVVPNDVESMTSEEIASAINQQTWWTATPTENGVSLCQPSGPYAVSIHSLDRGHPITPGEDGEWVYEDNGEKCNHNRPCKRCGKTPTPEGYDACLGYLEGIQYACCGHGVTDPVRIYKPWK